MTFLHWWCSCHDGLCADAITIALGIPRPCPSFFQHLSRAESQAAPSAAWHGSETSLGGSRVVIYCRDLEISSDHLPFPDKTPTGHTL